MALGMFVMPVAVMARRLRAVEGGLQLVGVGTVLNNPGPHIEPVLGIAIAVQSVVDPQFVDAPLGRLLVAAAGDVDLPQQFLSLVALFKGAAFLDPHQHPPRLGRGDRRVKGHPLRELVLVEDVAREVGSLLFLERASHRHSSGARYFARNSYP
jgi:hypothetical protein